jgi:[acyl-carrier-protein] S-malonyltransferase
VANVTADRMADPEAIREGLLRQITSCVRWSESMLRLRDAGATDFIEVGPGKVLVGLLRRIDKGLQGHNFGSPEDLEAVRALRG